MFSYVGGEKLILLDCAQKTFFGSLLHPGESLRIIAQRNRRVAFGNAASRQAPLSESERVVAAIQCAM